MKRCLRQRIRSRIWLVGGLLSWSIFIPIGCLTEAKAEVILEPGEAGETSLPVTPDAPASEALEPVAQEPTVSQLSDVKPTDWAYQALQSLIERYGIISGYPDGTFRGNRPLTRYEFAAALRAVLDQVETLIGSNIGSPFIQEDVITLQRLEQEYGDALDDLRTRLIDISDRNTELEANQFSTTTKLQGQIIIAPTTGTNASATIISRARLSLLTSFNESDLLVTQLEAGNGGEDAISLAHNKNLNLLGNDGLLADAGGLDYAGVDPEVDMKRLYYTFRPQSDLQVTIGARMLPRDFIDFNLYTSNEAAGFSSSFFINNPLIVQNQIDGAGAAIAWNPSGGKITLRSLYIASESNQPNSIPNDSGGLFGDPYQASVELEYLPSNKLALRLQYTNALINNTEIDAVGINAHYAFNRTTALFARLGLGSYEGYNPALAQNLDITPSTWSVGLALRNFFIPGTLAGVAIGQPFVTDDLGNATQTNFEAFYNFELSDNISITPIISRVSNANNESSNNAVWQATLRTVFSF